MGAVSEPERRIGTAMDNFKKLRADEPINSVKTGKTAERNAGSNPFSSEDSPARSDLI
jgi:hypothetical protein